MLEAAVAAIERLCVPVQRVLHHCMVPGSYSSTAESPEFIFQQFVIFHSCMFNTLEAQLLTVSTANHVRRRPTHSAEHLYSSTSRQLLTQCVRLLFEMHTNNGKFGSFSIASAACPFRTRYMLLLQL